MTVIVVIFLSDLTMLLWPLLQDKSDLTEKSNQHIIEIKIKAHLSIKTTVLHNREGPASVLALAIFIL